MTYKSKMIRAAWIGGACVIIAAIIGLLKPPTKNTTFTMEDQHYSPVTVAKDVNNITINLNVPPTATQEAIEALENKLKKVSTDVTLRRQEIQLLARSLRDLDQRTSGIEKLPDGRTRVGRIITGYPTIVIEEHNTAANLFKKGDFTGALKYSQRAIEKYEESQQDASIQDNLNKSDTATMYYVGAMSAHQLKKHEQAYEWADKANNIMSNSDRTVLLAATLFNINRRTEALQVLKKGLEENPDNPKLNDLKDELSKHMKAQ